MKEIFQFLDKHKNTVVWIILALILILFTIIKIPYLNNTFTGYHGMKYSSYVEPAKYMAENNDFTVEEKKYHTNPIIGSEDSIKPLSQFPLLPWKLAMTYKLLPNVPIELATRLFMHIVGIALLVFAFLFVKEVSNKRLALIFTLLLSTNVIVVFATYVTVYDSLNMVFLFISLYLFTLYSKNSKKIYFLALAGIIVGLGMSAKISILLWITPMIFGLLFLKKSNLSKKLFDFSTLHFFALISFLITKLATPLLNEKMYLSFLIFFLSIFFCIFLIKVFDKFKENILFFLETLEKKRILLPSMILLSIPVIYLSISFFLSGRLASEFLTDSKLIFNHLVYSNIFNHLFFDYTSTFFTILFILGCFSVFVFKDRGIRVLHLTFSFSMLFFIVLASKSIFFHNYYSIFSVSAILFGASVCIYFLFSNVKNIFLTMCLTFLILIFLLPSSIVQTRDFLSYEVHEATEVLEFFEDSLSSNEFYIEENFFTYFTIHLDIRRVGDFVMLEDEEFKKNVKEIGFKDTMDMYGIKYLLTMDAEPNYIRFANIFSEQELLRPSYRRGDAILAVLDPENHTYYYDVSEREVIVEEYGIKEKFVLEKEFGVFRIFSFQN